MMAVWRFAVDRHQAVAAGFLILLHALACCEAQAGNPKAAVTVRTEAELVAAIVNGSQPILVVQSIFVDSQLPTINKSVSISGDPLACKDERRGYCRIDGKRKSRLFEVATGGALTLTNIMIARGTAPESRAVGGAILVHSHGVLSADVVIFRYNSATGATSGGGAVEVESGGIFRARNSFFLRNFAGFGGAVAGAKGAVLSITNSIFNRNTALTAGGCVSLVLNSTATLVQNNYNYNQAAIGGVVQVDASTASLCGAWNRANNATLMGPQVYAANYARIFACKLSFNYVTLTSGASVTQSCALC